MNEYPSFITTLEEDEDGNLIFEIPDDLLLAMGWKEGTTLDISAIGSSIVLREVKSDHLEETS